jgi:hypothetical protein
MTKWNLYSHENKEEPYNDKFITKLRRNFRSHEQILELSNRLFYEGELIVSIRNFILLHCDNVLVTLCVSGIAVLCVSGTSVLCVSGTSVLCVSVTYVLCVAGTSVHVLCVSGTSVLYNRAHLYCIWHICI